MLVVPLTEGTGLQHDGTEALEPAPKLPWTGGFGTHAPLAKTFELAPGRYQARLAIEVAGLARRGAATVTFDVPPLAGLRLSSPIVTDRLGDRLDRAPRPVVRGLKAFWPNATLYCQFEVYGATREPGRALVVEAGYTVHAPDGTTARSAGPTRIQPTPDGRVLRLFGFPLGGLAPGVYSLAVDVRDGTSGATTAATDTLPRPGRASLSPCHPDLLGSGRSTANVGRGGGGGIEQATQASVSQAGGCEFATRDVFKQRQISGVPKTHGAETASAIKDRPRDGIEEGEARGRIDSGPHPVRAGIQRLCAFARGYVRRSGIGDASQRVEVGLVGALREFSAAMQVGDALP